MLGCSSGRWEGIGLPGLLDLSRRLDDQAGTIELVWMEQTVMADRT